MLIGDSVCRPVGGASGLIPLIFAAERRAFASRQAVPS
jgi:hypothetical protein